MPERADIYEECNSLLEIQCDHPLLKGASIQCGKEKVTGGRRCTLSILNRRNLLLSAQQERVRAQTLYSRFILKLSVPAADSFLHPDALLPMQ